jgi:dTDP-4-amino-4,6-dideoxygalactose transaminase
MIDFNRPYLTGNETKYIEEAVNSGKISGNGMFTKKCQHFFEEKYGFQKCLLTTSCTDALEMAAMLCDIKPGDEVIIPSYTFVSTAIAFIRQGAKVVFADSQPNHPNLDINEIEKLITDKTKVIVPVHYAGIACDMDKLMKLANQYGLLVVEDAAQAVDSYYSSKQQAVNRRALGGIGHLAAFSFHETKNIISGEGGMLVINDKRFIHRSEIIWEKGTNRAEFFRGEVNKYGWVDIGSSFLPSEVIAAFLWAQLENLEIIQKKRIQIWNRYYEGLWALAEKKFFKLPEIPEFASNNGHMFYLVCNTLEERTNLIKYLKSNEILSVFHYLSLHKSDFYADKHDGRELPNSDYFTDCLVRLPFYFELSLDKIDFIIDKIAEFYEGR